MAKVNNKAQLLRYIKKQDSTTASSSILKSYAMFMEVMKDKRYRVDWDRFDRLIGFFGLFKHYTGGHNGKTFKLEFWQKFIILNIFCIFVKKSGVRKYQSSYIQVARKNGKSALASIMGLYALLADDEANAQVVLAANSKEQANIVFKMCERFVGQVCKKYVKTYKTSKIFYRDINELFIISSDARLQDGLNPSFAICDEMHEAKSDALWQVIKSGMGMRSNPHLMTITTAGFNKGSACYNLRRYSLDILDRIQQDDTHFSMIFEIDEEDDYTNSDVWRKANPNLGITVNTEWLKTQITQAQNDPMMTTPVLTKNLNLWVDVAKTWIPEKFLIDSLISKEEFYNILQSEEKILYAGVDLASVCDLTAASYMFEHNGILYFNIEYFLPVQFKAHIEHQSKYKEWYRQNYIHLTPGNVTDYDYILANMMQMMEISTMYKCFYDSYNSTQFVINAEAEGVPMEPYSQSLGSFNKPTKEMERLIISGAGIRFVRNPVTVFCFRNAALKFDYNNNCKPVKGAGIDTKIDGVIASIMAIAAYLKYPSYSVDI